MKRNELKRNGLTLVELLVVLAIICVLVFIVASLVGGFGFSKDPATGKSYYDVTNTKTYRCIKTYTATTGSGDSTSTSKRVDLKEIDSNGNEVGIVQTFNCDDDFRAGISNSGTLYGQFESDKFYSVTSIGFRQEGWYSFFPLVKSVSEVPDPTQ